MTCDQCQGRGYVPRMRLCVEYGHEPCKPCKGTGEIDETTPDTTPLPFVRMRRSGLTGTGEA